MAHQDTNKGGSDTPSAAEVRQLLSRHLPGDHDCNHRCTVEGPIRTPAGSAIYRATCVGIPHSVLIKRPHDNDTSAGAQHEALCRAARRMRPLSGLRVPISYPYLVDDGFVMVEFIEAVDLQQFLHNPRSRSGSVISALERAGAWLAAYHREDQQHRAFISVDELLNNVRRKAASGTFGHPRRDPFTKYFDLLLETAGIAGCQPVTVALEHGDFKPHNLLVNGDEIVGIDIPDEGPMPVVHDLAHFLLHLDTVLLHPAAWRLLPCRSRLRAAFLRGYRRDSPASTIDARSFAWAELQRVLDLYYGRRGMSKSWARAAMSEAGYLLCAYLRVQNLRRAFRMTLSATEVDDGSAVVKMNKANRKY